MNEILFLRKILTTFPNIGLKGFFGYGSGVLRQINSSNSSSSSSMPTYSNTNMIDTIFIVDNPIEWHKENLEIHSNHYQWYYRKRGAAHIAHIQQTRAARVYFNTEIYFEKRLMKYGVISERDLIDDLLHWRYLYIAGRLQKPVLWVVPPSNEPPTPPQPPTEQQQQQMLQNDNKSLSLHEAYQLHLKRTIALSLLLLPTTFSEYELFHVVASLSYGGDLLRKVVENPCKVDNIVSGQLTDFRQLYGPYLHDMKEVDWRNAFSDLLMRNSSFEAQCSLLSQLPLAFLQRIYSIHHQQQKTKIIIENKDELSEQLAQLPTLKDDLRTALAKIISPFSYWQSWQNFLTAGPQKSLVYTMRKLKKKFN